MKFILTKLYKLLSLDFLYTDIRLKRGQFVSSIALPICNQTEDKMKFTSNRPIYAGVLQQYVTWNEWLDLLVRHGWVVKLEKYNGYYVGDIDNLLRLIHQDVEAGKLKLDEDLMMYKCNVNAYD